MTTALLAPPPIFRAYDNSGNPLAGGLLYSYAAGTTTPQATYPSSSESTPNTNPIVLNFRGECPLWLDPSLSYKLNLTDPFGNTIPGYPVDNISGPGAYIPAVVTQSYIGMTLWPQTAAEVAANVTPTFFYYAPGDLRRYGADPSGTNASDAAIASAIAVCGSTGGTIHAPGGVYKFNNTIALNSQQSIILQGDGGPNGGLTAGTQFTFAGTGTGDFIDFRSSAGCQIRGMQIEHSSSAFTGIYVDFSHDSSGHDSQNCGIFDCYLGANIGTGCTHLNLDKAINVSVERCDFQFGSPAIQGQAHAGGSYSNGARIVGCQFVASIIVPIQDMGEAWTISGCIFENLSSGAAGAITTNGTTTQCVGLIMTGCWLGDVSVTSACTWVNGFYSSTFFSGNEILGNATGTTAFSLAATNSTSIIGNNFSTLLVGVNFQSGGGGSHSVTISNNLFNSVGTPITNSANHDSYLVFNPNSVGTALAAPPNIKNGVFAQNGMEVSPNGIVRMWGKATGLSNGSNTVTLPGTFPTGCFSVTATLCAVVNLTATCYVGPGPGTTNFTLTINDATASGTDAAFWMAVGN